MKLPFEPPIEPMLAKAADALPEGDGWLFEPKWDGFRALVFRDGDEILIQSRDLKPLDRYFPELAEPLRASLPERCVVDGEIVIAGDGGLEFEALLLRIHPAASRVRCWPSSRPRRSWPGTSSRSTTRTCATSRRASDGRGSRASSGSAAPPVHLTPATRIGRSPPTGSTASRAPGSTA